MKLNRLDTEYPINIPIAKDDIQSPCISAKDIKKLKAEAKKKGQSLRVYVSGILKKHVNEMQLKLM